MYPWFSEMYIANISSGDWAVLAAHCLVPILVRQLYLYHTLCTTQLIKSALRICPCPPEWHMEASCWRAFSPEHKHIYFRCTCWNWRCCSSSTVSFLAAEDKIFLNLWKWRLHFSAAFSETYQAFVMYLILGCSHWTWQLLKCDLSLKLCLHRAT